MHGLFMRIASLLLGAYGQSAELWMPSTGLTMDPGGHIEIDGQVYGFLRAYLWQLVSYCMKRKNDENNGLHGLLLYYAR